jgi:hypothetical protein
LAVVAAVTDDENSMVQVALVASLIVEEPSGVELEFVGGIDGDGDWAGLSNGVSEGIFVSRWEVVVPTQGGDRLGTVESAVVVLGLVGISRFAHDTVVVDVAESAVHPATIATGVAVAAGAIDQVLFAEGGETSSLESELTFNGTSGTETPARSALSLVLDFTNSVASPVDGGCEWLLGGHVRHAEVFWVLGFLGLTTVDVSQEFLFAHVSELVHGLGVGHFSLLEFGIVFRDLGHVVFEDELTADFFNRRTVRFLVGQLELAPLFLEERFWQSQSGGESQAEDKEGLHRYSWNCDELVNCCPIYSVVFFIEFLKNGFDGLCDNLISLLQSF